MVKTSSVKVERPVALAGCVFKSCYSFLQRPSRGRPHPSQYQSKGLPSPVREDSGV